MNQLSSSGEESQTMNGCSLRAFSGGLNHNMDTDGLKIDCQLGFRLAKGDLLCLLQLTLLIRLTFLLDSDTFYFII